MATIMFGGNHKGRHIASTESYSIGTVWYRIDKTFALPVSEYANISSVTLIISSHSSIPCESAKYCGLEKHIKDVKSKVVIQFPGLSEYPGEPLAVGPDY